MFEISEERPFDAAGIETLLDLGFGENRKHRLVNRLRQGPPVASLSLVNRASSKNRHPHSDPGIIASIRYWRIELESCCTALLLGPLAVDPAWQGLGYGRRLVSVSLDRAREQAWGLCLVSGDPKYYATFGFRSADGLGLLPPGTIEAGRLQVLELEADALSNARRRLRPSASMIWQIHDLVIGGTSVLSGLSFARRI